MSRKKENFRQKIHYVNLKLKKKKKKPNNETQTTNKNINKNEGNINLYKYLNVEEKELYNNNNDLIKKFNSFIEHNIHIKLKKDTKLKDDVINLKN